MIKKVIVAFIIFFYVYSVRFWLQCRDLMYYYHFTSLDLRLQIINLITYEYKQGVLVARIFHNKPVQFVIDIYKRYTHFFDPQLFITLLSFAGFVGLIFGFWYFFKNKKSRPAWFLFILMFLLPLAEVLINLKIDFPIRIIAISLPFIIFSIFGHLQFMKNHKSLGVVVFYIILFLITAGWFLNFPHDAFNYCTK